MYFAYGWPKVLSALDGTRQEDVVYLHSDRDFLVVVSTTSIQLWTGGQHRVKLGLLTRDQASLRTEGLNRKAFWSSSKKLLAVLTYHNVLHIYGVHHSKESVLTAPASPLGGSPAVDLRKVAIYLQQSLPLDGTEGSNAATTDLVADSRSILVAFTDGTCQIISWAGQLRGTVRPLASQAEVQGLLDLPRTLSSASARSLSGWPGATLRPLSNSLGPHYLSGSPKGSGSGHGVGPMRTSSSDRTPTSNMRRSGSGGSQLGGLAEGMGLCIEWLDYAVSLRLLAALLGDGRCAILRTSDAGLFPAQHIEFSHWVCTSGSGATCVRIGVAAQLVAVGLGTGEVAIHRLWPAKAGTDALRIISLADWGYEPEATGSVADLHWSPDNRVLAVGWRRSGLGLWTPSGCRLMCSLRQTATHAPPRTPQSLSSSTAFPAISLEAGVAALAWGLHGFRLTVAEAGSHAQVVELALVHSLPSAHRIIAADELVARGGGPSPECHLLLADDRLLLISDRQRPVFPDLPGVSDGQASSSGREETASLTVQHLRPPAVYIGANWPLAHAAISSDGMDLAVAGTRGMALYSRRSSRWRLFGDISQERDLAVQVLLWLPRMVLACASLGSGTASGKKGQPDAGVHLLLYPRYHLDNSSLLGRHTIQQAPLAMDVCGAHLVVASAPLDITVFRIDLTGALTPLGAPAASFTIVRQLSIMSPGQPLQDIALVDMPAVAIGAPRRKAGGRQAPAEAQHCLLKRAGGILSVLDMDQGSELTLAEDVESFWVADRSTTAPLTAGLLSSSSSSNMVSALDSGSSRDLAGKVGANATVASAAAQAAPVAAAPVSDDGAPQRSDSGKDASVSGREEVEIPWWTYGARGMQLWFPSALAEPLSPGLTQSLSEDPELEFDREVYPIGISLSDVSVIGVTQRVQRAALGGQTPAATPTAGPAFRIAHTSLPAFHPVPESQPVLPCLLRRLLLQQDRGPAALALARRHASAPHFAQSLEWLLFTALEANSALTGSSPNRRKSGANGSTPAGSQPKKPPPTAGPLLLAAADLIRSFPQFGECVVSVARKTDAALWPPLFAAVGEPSALAEDLLAGGALHRAACALLIVDRLQGSSTAHELALRLMQVSLEEGLFQLAAELLRYVQPFGETHTANGSLEPISRPAAPERSRPARPSSEGGGWWGKLFRTNDVPASPAARAGSGDGSDTRSSAAADGQALAARHAMQLVRQGALRAAALLGEALAAVGVHLPDFVAAFARTPAQAKQPTGLDCLAALTVVEAELPVVSDPEAAWHAQLLLDCCLAAGAVEWAFALGLTLEAGPALADIQARHSRQWQEFSHAVTNEEHWAALWPSLEAVNRAAAPGIHTNSAIQVDAALIQ